MTGYVNEYRGIVTMFWYFSRNVDHSRNHSFCPSTKESALFLGLTNQNGCLVRVSHDEVQGVTGWTTQISVVNCRIGRLL